jgi:hypothetical protein
MARFCSFSAFPTHNPTDNRYFEKFCPEVRSALRSHDPSRVIDRCRQRERWGACLRVDGGFAVAAD